MINEGEVIATNTITAITFTITVLFDALIDAGRTGWKENGISYQIVPQEMVINENTEMVILRLFVSNHQGWWWSWWYKFYSLCLCLL